MSAVKTSDLLDVAVLLRNGGDEEAVRKVRAILAGNLFAGLYIGEVVAKERPRMGANKRMYTPTRTRKFEEAVREWSSKHRTTDGPVTVPLCVSITVYDYTDDPALLKLGKLSLVKKQSKDLDNMAKSILDACIGVLYADDKQVTSLKLTRKYNEVAGFRMAMTRDGLAAHEHTTIRNLLTRG